ncbi:sensor histidine kinase [Clostridioides difficile]
MNKYIIILVLIVIINIVISSFIIYQYRKKIVIQYNILLHKIDKILTGKKLDISYDESLDSAISERLNQIIEISDMQKNKAEEERDIVKSLISDISHQIRTPLANIILYTGLLKEEIIDKKTIQLSDKIEKNAEKLEFFMKELIKSSYAEQGLISTNPQSVEVDKLIKKGCQLAELNALKKNINISSTYNGYKAYADPKWTEEVFSNIIENSIKYSPEDSTVFINSVLYDTFVCVQIKDTGMGIPEEEQGKIFQRFYRGSNIKDKQGFGIGLYLAREVLNRQQGYIKVKSKLNKGTTVEIFLLRRDS